MNRDVLDLEPSHYGLTNLDDWFNPALCEQDISTRKQVAPSIEAEEKVDRFMLYIKLPLPNQSVDHVVENQELQISQSHNEELETSTAPFSRRFSIPDYISRREIEFQKNGGTLEVSLPKKNLDLT